MSEQQIKALFEARIKGFQIKLIDPEEGLKPETKTQQVAPPAQQNFTGFMMDIVRNPLFTTTERIASLMAQQVIARKEDYYDMVSEIRQKGFIESFKLKSDNSRGKPSRYEALTERGRAVLLKTGLIKENAPLWNMRGSFLHYLISEIVSDRYTAAGFQTWIEKNGTDVLVSRDNRSIAIEVSLTTEAEEIRNIQRNFSVGIERVLIIAVESGTDSEGCIQIDERKSASKKKMLEALIFEALIDESRVRVLSYDEWRKSKELPL